MRSAHVLAAENFVSQKAWLHVSDATWWKFGLEILYLKESALCNERTE